MKVKSAKKPKDKLGQRALVGQDDYYTEATAYEEQAERWMLSDVKKTLRNYLQALDLYEKGLNAPLATPKGTYNIAYNKTRLVLQVYITYVANSGYMNLLQYLKLDDIQGLEAIIIPLPEIVRQTENVFEQFSEIRTWDLESNLLTCYLTLLESAEECLLQAEDIIQLTKKFTELTINSMNFQMSELQRFASIQLEDDDDESNNIDAGSIANGQANYMEQADQVTTETLLDVLVGGLKYVQTLMELVIESRLNTSEGISMNPIQANYLEDMAMIFTQKLDEMRINIGAAALEDKELINVLNGNRGIGIVTSGDITAVENYIQEGTEDSNLDLLLGKIDVLTFVLTCYQNRVEPDVSWKLCSLLNKLLTKVVSNITSLRSDIISGKVKNMNDQLSRVVFQLSDVLINSSDNELRRWQIKANSANDNSSKILEILMKNAKTLLNNALKISERPCGMEEYIVDKLRRNYIYQQARARLDVLTDPKKLDEAVLSDLIGEHSFYRNIRTL